MNTAKVYTDSEGNDCTIFQMVKREPGWAANRIQRGEDALALLEEIRAWDIQNFMNNSKFTLPIELRKKIQGIGA